MAKSISELLKDADELITKKIASVSAPTEDDVVKLANELRSVPANQEVPADDIFTLTEKLAHAAALLDTLINAQELAKIASFEASAKEKGYTPEQISEFFEKRASVSFRSVTELIPGFGS
jgi:hypothetical protein